MTAPEAPGPPAAKRQSVAFAYVLVCLVPVVWGASGVLVRWTHLGGHEPVIVFWRSLFATVFFVIVTLVLRRFEDFRPRGRTFLLVASGLLSLAFAFTIVKAYDLLTIGSATFILYLYPVMVAVMAPLLLEERLERSAVVCLGIALVGTALLSWGQAGTGGGSSARGIAFAAAAALSWAVLMIIWKKLRETHSPLTIGIWMNAVAAAVIAPVALPSTGLVTPQAWPALAAFGTISVGAASLAYFFALKRVRVQDAAILSYIEPVSAMLLGLAFLGEVPRWQDLAGAALIIAAGALLLKLRVGRAQP